MKFMESPFFKRDSKHNSENPQLVLFRGTKAGQKCHEDAAEWHFHPALSF
jgi:hypothetical protein